MSPMSGATLWTYVDESIHDSLGFIVTAFLFSEVDLDEPVSRALLAVGLTPGLDEYKSGQRMAGNPQMRAAREALLSVACGTRMALLVSAAKERESLRRSVLSALLRCITVNEIRADRLLVFFDQGLVRPGDAALSVGAAFMARPGCELHFQQDSRSILGLQAADLVAHAMAQVLREEMGKLHKQLPLGGNEGYEEGTKTSLGWILRVEFRRSFLYSPAADVEADNGLDQALHPDLLGWGVLLDPALSAEVGAAASRVFSKVWLGCLH
jgi:hypothetical protein